MDSLLFKTQFSVRMHDTDSAGVMFYARAFYYAHDAYEDFLQANEQSISDLLQDNFILPISHTDADFKAPVFLDDKIEIEIFRQAINESDFTLTYHFINHKRTTCIIASTSHVCLGRQSRKRMPLPAALNKILTA